MRRRIALMTLAGLFGTVLLAAPAEARGHRKQRGGCGGGVVRGRGHHGGKYVTYNGSNFNTYPYYEQAPYAPPAPGYGPGYNGSPYAAPAAPGGMMPPPPPMGS